MDRNTAYELVKMYVKNKNLRKHMLATEAIMKRLAREFNQDEEKWGLAGLVHDIDYDQTVNDFPNHGLVGAKILKEKGFDEEIIQAVKSHPGHVPRTSLMDKALYAVDPLTGLIVASALIHPSKKLSAIDNQFVLNRFGEKRFAAGANRDQIKTCAELGLSLEDFIRLGLEAMQEIATDLGL